MKGLSNFAGAESPRNVAAGMLSFTHGHPLSDLAIREIRDRFKGYFWGYNGPQVITRALKKYCAVSKVCFFKDFYKCIKEKRQRPLKNLGLTRKIDDT